jgi:hypothetical protein
MALADVASSDRPHMMRASAPRGPYTELGPIAAALAVAYAGAPEIRFSRDGLDVVVDLRIDSGMVRGVDVRIGRKGLPEIEFRRETDADRGSKASGMNVEVQTGDATFDAFVYIESSYRESVLGPLLQSPELRRAIGELVAAAGTVTLDQDGITVDTRALGLGLLDPARFLPIFGSVLRIAQLFPSLPAGTTTPRERGSGLLLLSAFSFVVGIAFAVLLRDYGQPDSSLLRALGLTVGIALAIAARPLVRARVRGHARSTLYLQTTTVASLLGAPLLMMSVLVFVNAFFDPSIPVRLSGKVVAAKNYLDDGTPMADLTIAWNDGKNEDFSLHDTKPAIQVGDDAALVRRKGLLGFSWTEKPLTVGKPARSGR